MPSPAALNHAAVGSHVGMRCSRLCTCVEWKFRREKSNEKGRGPRTVESGESGADMQGTWNIGVGKLHAPASSSRVSPRQGKELGRFRFRSWNDRVTHPCPPSSVSARSQCHHGSSPSPLGKRDGLLRNTLTWYILYTASTRPRIACRSGLHPQAAGSSPFPHQVSTM